MLLSLHIAPFKLIVLRCSFWALAYGMGRHIDNERNTADLIGGYLIRAFPARTIGHIQRHQ